MMTLSVSARRKIEFFFPAVLSVIALILSGCSVFKSTAAPTSPFLIHADELHPEYERAPWDGVWSADPDKIVVKLDHIRRIYIAPVDTAYMNLVKDKEGNWVVEREVDSEDVAAITELIEKSFKEALGKTEKTNLIVEEMPGNDTMILMLALTELKPTVILVNSVAGVGGLLVPGAKLIENAMVIGGQAASGALASGSIAIEMKILENPMGKVIAEAKDRESDPMTILPNYRDFQKYGWHRKAVRDWAKQLGDAFSTSSTERVAGSIGISILPW